MTRNEKTSVKSTKSNGSRSRSNTAASTKANRENLGCARKFSAVLTRILFLLHSSLAIWRVSLEYSTIYIYFICIGVGLLVVELIFTLVVRQGREYKWFCPSVGLYLLTVVPCLWLLELSQLDKIYGNPTHIELCNKKQQAINLDTSQNSSLAYLTVKYYNDSATDDGNSSRTKREILMVREFLLLKDRVRREVEEGGKKQKDKRRKIRKKNRKPYLKDLTLTSSTAQSTVFTLSTNSTSTMPVSPDGIEATTFKMDRNATKLPLTVLTTTSKVDFKSKVTEKFVTTSSTPSTVTENPLIEEIDEGVGANIKHKFDELGKNTVLVFSDAKTQVDNIVKKLDFLGPERWLLALHQCLLFVLVIGRWLLPKGEITKDQLSQLLLVFIGVGADILEFVTETIENEELGQITCDYVLFYVIYGVWSWSLFQFTLVLTASKSRKTRVGFGSEITRISTRGGCCANTIFNNADLWGILATMFLQDAPFLAVRFYIMVEYKHVHQMMLFFTIKNFVVVLLQIYRIIVIHIEHHSGRNNGDNEIGPEEMQPLRSTLKRLAKHATTDEGPDNSDIKTASFKRKKDGSLTVKLILKNEKKRS